MVRAQARYTGGMNLEEIANEYLTAKAEAKAASQRADKAKSELADLLQDGDEVSVQGYLYEWRITVGRNPSYKKVLDWLKEVCPPDISVLIEEGSNKFTGSRVTKDLKLVDED